MASPCLLVSQAEQSSIRAFRWLENFQDVCEVLYINEGNGLSFWEWTLSAELSEAGFVLRLAFGFCGLGGVVTVCHLIERWNEKESEKC